MKYSLVFAVLSLIVLSEFSTVSGHPEYQYILRRRRGIGDWFTRRKEQISAQYNNFRDKFNHIKKQVQTVNKHYVAIKQDINDLRKTEIWQDMVTMHKKVAGSTEDKLIINQFTSNTNGLQEIPITSKEILKEANSDVSPKKVFTAGKEYERNARFS